MEYLANFITDAIHDADVAEFVAKLLEYVKNFFTQFFSKDNETDA